jgi:hypothetical protein
VGNDNDGEDPDNGGDGNGDHPYSKPNPGEGDDNFHAERECSVPASGGVVLPCPPEVDTYVNRNYEFII